jgi:hypothetical protein
MERHVGFNDPSSGKKIKPCREESKKSFKRTSAETSKSRRVYKTMVLSVENPKESGVQKSVFPITENVVEKHKEDEKQKVF